MFFYAFKKVFQKPLYAAIGILTGLTSFVFIIWLPNIGLVAEVLFSSGSFSERIALPVSLLGTISTNFTTLSASFVIAMAVLFGMNAAMTAFFIHRRISCQTKRYNGGIHRDCKRDTRGRLRGMRFNSSHDSFGVGRSGRTHTIIAPARRRIQHCRSNSPCGICFSYRQAD